MAARKPAAFSPSKAEEVAIAMELGQLPDKSINRLVEALPERFVRDLVHSRVGFDGKIIANLKEVQYRARQLVDESFDDTEQFDVRGNPIPQKDSVSREEALKLLDAANTKMIKFGSEILSMERVNKIEQTMLAVVHKFLDKKQWDQFMTELDAKLHPFDK